MPPNFVEAPLIIENFFCTCPPVWGCDPSQGSFQKNVTRLKRRLQRIYLNLVKGLLKMVFPHFKHMHLGSVSLAFMRVCKMASYYSFNQNSAFGVISRCLGFSVFQTFWVYGYLSKGLIEFSKLVCLDKHHYSLCLVL